MGQKPSKKGAGGEEILEEPRLLPTGNFASEAAIMAWKKRKDGPFFPKHSCDECRKLIEENRRYHCTECSNYDMCESCFELDLHEKEFPGHALALEVGLPQEVAEDICFDPALQDNLLGCLNHVVASFPDRRAFGYRRRDGQPVWIKYRSVQVIVQNCVRALLQLSHQYKLSVVAGDVASDDLTKSQVVQRKPTMPLGAIVCSNRPEFFYADFALTMVGHAIVPLYVTMSSSVLLEVLEETECWIVFINLTSFQKLNHDNPALPQLKVVVITECAADLAGTAMKLESRPDVRVMGWDDFVQFGADSPERRIPGRNIDDLFTVIYTSGSTGKPKGVMHSGKSWLYTLVHSGSWMNDPMVMMSFTPLGHSSGRRFVWQTFFAGGRTFFINDDMYPADDDKLDRIIRECAYASPVVLSSTPRLWNALHSMYLARLAEAQKANTDPMVSEKMVQKQVLKEFRWKLGVRLRIVSVGGGSSSTEVQNWMFECFQCITNNGFGTTETGSVAAGGVGGAMAFAPTTQWKLRSIPELGYDANGNPPRGELLVKTPSTAMGYFKQVNQTRTAFTSDGYFATGDVVEVQDGECRIIDRCKNFVKLAQGEYVAVEHVESVVSTCETIEQVCIHADPLRSFLLAVVVPNFRVLKTLLQFPGDLSPEEMCAHPVVYKTILEGIALVAVKNELQGFECPRGLVLTPIQFTAENGLLTGSVKPDRRAIATKFAKELTAKYNEMDSVEVRLRDVLVSVLGEKAGDLSKLGDASFRDMGGDSLRGQMMQKKLEEIGIKVPISMILGPNKLRDLGEFVAARLEEGADKDLVEAFDMTLASQIPENIKFVPLAQDAPPPSKFFLTGATGFLGIYILQSLLEVGAERIYCLVRGKDLMHARARLHDQMTRAKLELDLSRIKVIRGDCAEKSLGMSEADWDMCRADVDCIIHCAALVNSRMSVEQLLPSNAGSVRECLRLCDGRPVRFVYVSTAGVWYPFVTQGIRTKEDETALPWDPSMRHQMGGYTCSKLCGELMCHKAREKGLDVRIVRPSSIAPHPVTGFYNVEDTYSRIISACILQSSHPTNLQHHTINLIDVDWCSKAVVVCASAPKFPRAINIVNSKSTSWETLFTWLRKVLPQVKALEFTEWSDLLKKTVQSSESITASQVGRTHPLMTLLPRFASSFPYFGDLYDGKREVHVQWELSDKALGGSAPAITQEAFAASVKRML